MLLTIGLTIFSASFLLFFIFWHIHGRMWMRRSLRDTSNFPLELALREHDDLLVFILFQHQTTLSAIKGFFDDTEWPCDMVGSAFEGCFVPKCLESKREIANEFDFFLRLPLPVAGESPEKELHYVLQKQKPLNVVLKLSNLSILTSDYLCIAKKVDNLRETFLNESYIHRKFIEAVEENVIRSLEKFLEKNPGGMEMMPRKEINQSTDFCPSVRVMICQAINERLDMLPLDPDTWSGHVMENAVMLFVNLTNWCSSPWPTRIFNCHLVIPCEWPKEGRIKWLQRDRFWPSHSVVEKVARSSCYLLPLWTNSRDVNKTDKEAMEFKMTFSMAEVLLLLETEPKEKQCIVLLKSLKERYFIDCQIISSFSIKMVFFWYLESTSWHERQTLGRGELLEKLLNKFIGFLSERNLPHFFVPIVNLLDDFSTEEIRKTVKLLRNVKNNLLDSLGPELFQLKYTTLFTEDLVNKIISFV